MNIRSALTVSSRLALVTTALLALLPGTSPAIPIVTNCTTVVYTNVTDPVKLVFAPDGTLFVGRDNSGSGGSPSDAVKIHKIGTNASSLVEFGNVALTDPDAVGYDAVGLVSGSPGAVLVGGSAGSSGATISRITSAGIASTIFGGVITNANNPGEFLFDASGRVYISDTTTHRVLTTASTAAPTVLCVSTGAYALAFDASNRLAVGSFDLPRIQLFATNGTLLSSNFATIRAGAPVVAGRGDAFWGRDLYSLNNLGQLIRIDPLGTNTVIGSSGFANPCQMAFGPDKALYVAEKGLDVIYRITEKIVNVPQPDHWWPGEGNGNDIIGSAHGVLAKSDGFNNVNFTPGFSYPTGVVGQCFFVDTNHSAFNFGTNAANVGTNDFTLCFWFNSTNTASRGLFGNQLICFYNTSWSVDIYNAGAVRLIVDEYGGAYHYAADRFTTAKVCDGQWHHVAVQRNGLNPKIYLDGVEAVGANTGSYPANTGQLANITNSTRFLMGGSSGTPDGYCSAPSNLKDAFDEVQLYYTALGADQIAKLAALQANTYGPPRLNIAPLPNAVRLTWTTNSAGFALETNSSLTLTNWGVLTTNYSIIETNYAVTNALGGATRFYRLHKP